MTDDLKSPFNPDGGKFAENIRSIKGDDEALRESMKRVGWIKHFPAFTDENNVVIVGHRRLKIADELKIKPVIEKLTFGKGDAADTKRLQLAIASNTGGKGLTKGDRKRIATHLYKKLEWTMQAIADAINVSKKTISLDLAGVVTDGNNPPRPKGGRPKGSGKRGEGEKFAEACELIRPRIEANEDLKITKLAQESGISRDTLERAALVEQARLKALKNPIIKPADLSLTAQQKLDAAMRQQQRKQESEFHQRVNARVQEFVDETILPDWRKKIDEARKLYDKRKALMDKDTFNTIRRALHPDSRQSISDKKLAEAFDAFMALEKYLLDEKSSPTEFGENLPMDFSEAAKRRAAEARRTKRTASAVSIR